MTPTQRWTMVGTILGSTIVFLDGTVVNVALKVIGEQLPATVVGVLEGQTYVVSGYLATLAALLILAGALGDYYGRRRIFAIGLAGFGTTSIMCGLAPTLELLAIFRVLQGATGALLVPGSLSIITATFEGPARARAFGIWAAATSATTAVGPLVGGYLVDAVSWRAAFLLNVPLVVLALYATLARMEESRDEQSSGRFDWLGAFVGVVAIGGLAFGGIRGQDKQWQDPLAFIALGIGAIALIAFPVLMAVRPNPLVPLSLFRRRAFGVINLSTFLIYGALYVNFGFQGLYLQGTLGYSAFGAGATGLPVSILLTVLSTRVGTLAGRYGPRPFLVAGPLIMAAGLLWLARIPHTSEPWLANPAVPSTLLPPSSVLADVLPSIVLFGIGISLVVAPLTSTLMDSIPVRYAGLGSAINNAVSRVGQPLLSAVIFIVLSQVFYGDLARLVPGLPVDSPGIRRQATPLNRPPDGLPEDVRAAALVASTDAFHVAVLVGAGLLVAGAVVNGAGLRSGGAVRPEDAD
jgi:EmrB/QacA subfamily drug resistance transporter